MRPWLRYSLARDAYVLRGVGRHIGPVLRPDRRRQARRPGRFDGIERRRVSAA